MAEELLTNKIGIVFVFMISGLCGLALSLHHHRILSSTQTHNPVALLKQLEGDPLAGEKIFKEFCATCHATNAVINTHAPRIGDKKSWQGLNRIGMPTLLNITKNGVPPMPPRGGCFECSDEQLRLTIQHMLDKSL